MRPSWGTRFSAISSPDITLSLEDMRRDIWIGALLTAALFSFGQYLIGYLIGRNEIASLYDAAGSILVLMLWVFYASAILFFGASFTFSLANVSGDPVAAVKRVAATRKTAAVRRAAPARKVAAVLGGSAA